MKIKTSKTDHDSSDTEPHAMKEQNDPPQAVSPASIAKLSPDDPLLKNVISLWRKNSETLGFFPEGAFLEYAQKGQILIATTATNNLLGYLAYRRSRNRAAIIHLCIDSALRGKGTARALVDRLCIEARSCTGISIRCRRDFSASTLWPKLKFEAVNEISGRGREGKTLTIWHRDLGNPDLFRHSRRGHAATKIRAVVDANVFYDLSDEAPQGVESRALLADWIDETVELQVTPEMSNEIARATEPAVRQRNRAAMTYYSKGEETETGAFDSALTKISAILPSPKNESDESDRRQLAWAVAASVEYFLTRDSEILRAADDLYSRTGILAIRPAEFVRRLDELERAEQYAPARLGGTRLKWRSIRAGEEDCLADSLHFGTDGESRSAFFSSLRAYACDPRLFDTRGVFEDENTALALIVFDRTTTGVLRLPFLRLGKSRAMVTLARHLLYKAQCAAVEDGREVVELHERLICPELESALEAEDWACGPDGIWRRWNFRFIGDASSLMQRIRESRIFEAENAKSFVAEIERLLARACEGDVTGAVRVERLLWPSKILGAGIPTFMVPIKPGWAQHFVDERLAEQLLFGARDDLALNREAVYYRSPQKPAPTAPGRVLWYVTKDDATRGAMSIRACSAIDSVSVEPGREAFRNNRRFGVYDWRDVKDLMKESDDGAVMSIRFSNTELLSRPIELEELRSILQMHGKGVMTAGPTPVEDLPFAAIYKAGGLT
ncbi:GNAT family N-acetyltransferase [Corallococcus sp. bb12-1]|uniref:GNAT family N-acetyltransferase n=1 Tax=Corallococcus sp. bb12-1 TaxID=2996784 RepID=UPI00226E3FF5|nr:GNAT family N-acetyltransferase [Corallococcus sp. bb12-1]MCY1045744.1 GNAT family N-acetyltransferase [Corallococcus sp. bb12-1]